MLADLVGDLVSSIAGEAVVEWLFPGLSKPQLSPPEGEWNASLASLSAFLAAIAALFCAQTAIGVLNGMTEPWICAVLGGALLLAMLSGVLAHRALEVTDRRRTLARAALWLSRATLITGLIAAGLAMMGIRTN